MKVNLEKAAEALNLETERQQSPRKTQETKIFHQPKEHSELNRTSQKPTEKLNYALPYININYRLG